MSERADIRIRLGRTEGAELWPVLSTPAVIVGRTDTISARHLQVSAGHHPRVLLAHDQALLRAALAGLLRAAFPSWVLHTSDGIASALARVSQIDADLVVLGLRAEDGDATSAIRELRQNRPGTRVVALLTAA